MALQINLGGGKSPYKAHIERLATLARIFTTADRILSGDSKIKCAVSTDDTKQAPSWTDGRTITFNANQIKNIVSLEDVIQVTGLNYHELAHVLYTPRYTSQLGQWVVSNKFNYAYNMLEDQRIETMLTSLYPATIPYFTATINRYLAEDKTQWERNFLLTHGRKYLPIIMREAFEKKFFKPHKRKAIKVIIDEYRTLVLPKDEIDAMRLITAFAKILELINKGNNQVVVGDPYGHSTDQRPNVSEGNVETQSVQVEIQEAVEAVDEALEERDDEVKAEKAQAKEEEYVDDSDEDSDSEDEEEDDSELSDEPTLDSDGNSDENGDNSDSDGEGNGESDSDSEGDDDSDSKSDGAGTEQGEVDTDSTPTDSNQDELDEIIKEAIAEANEEILSNPDVLAESARRKNTMIEGDGEVSLELSMKKLYSSRKQIDKEYLDISDDLAVELAKIKATLDPFWEDEKDTGRFNLRQYVRGADDNKVFDAYREGNVENTDIEAVILLDISGSMAGNTDRACRSVWAIKRALEKIDGKVTVIAFSDDSYILYDRNELAEDDKFLYVDEKINTVPTNGLRSAIDIFNASEHNNKILFVVTDGSWGASGRSNDELIQAMNEGGVHTALAFIGNKYYSSLDRHNCQYAQIIDDPIGLVNIAEEIAIQAMQQV